MDAVRIRGVGAGGRGPGVGSGRDRARCQRPPKESHPGSPHSEPASDAAGSLASGLSARSGPPFLLRRRLRPPLGGELLFVKGDVRAEREFRGALHLAALGAVLGMHDGRCPGGR